MYVFYFIHVAFHGYKLRFRHYKNRAKKGEMEHFGKIKMGEMEYLNQINLGEMEYLPIFALRIREL